MRRHVLVGKFTTDHRLGQDRIRRGKTSGDGKGREEFDLREDGPDEQRRDEPAPLRDTDGCRVLSITVGMNKL
jgi:hypothetical protein